MFNISIQPAIVQSPGANSMERVEGALSEVTPTTSPIGAGIDQDTLDSPSVRQVFSDPSSLSGIFAFIPNTSEDGRSGTRILKGVNKASRGLVRQKDALLKDIAKIMLPAHQEKIRVIREHLSVQGAIASGDMKDTLDIHRLLRRDIVSNDVALAKQEVTLASFIREGSLIDDAEKLLSVARQFDSFTTFLLKNPPLLRTSLQAGSCLTGFGTSIGLGCGSIAATTPLAGLLGMLCALPTGICAVSATTSVLDYFSIDPEPVFNFNVDYQNRAL